MKFAGIAILGASVALAAVIGPGQRAQAGSLEWTAGLSMSLPRECAGGVAIGASIYVVGGRTPFSLTPTGLLEVYDTTRNAWSIKQSLPIPRMTEAVSVNGLLYAVGGASTSTTFLGNLDCYDPWVSYWSPRAPMLVPRAEHSVVEVGGKIYAIGGVTSTLYYQSPVPAMAVERYDPVSDTWAVCTQLPTERRNAAAVAIGPKIYVIGGDPQYCGGTGTNQVYDTGADTWSTLAPMPLRTWGSAAAVLDGKIYVAGGLFMYEISCNAGLMYQVYVYDPGTDAWAEETWLPTPRMDLVASVVDEKIYAIGGSVSTGVNEIGSLAGAVSSVLTVSPSPVVAFQPTTVRLTITNDTPDTIYHLYPALKITEGDCMVSSLSGPVPFSATILAGSSTSFDWSLTVSVTGALAMKASALGYLVGGNTVYLSETYAQDGVDQCNLPPPVPPPGPPAPTGDDMLYVYPHPLKCPGGYAVFHMDKPGKANLRIMNMRGQVAKEITASLPAMQNAQVFIDCNEIKNGAYMLNGVLTYDDGSLKWLKPYKFVMTGSR